MTLQGCCHHDAFVERKHWHRITRSSLGGQACWSSSWTHSPPLDGASVRALYALACQVVQAFLQVGDLIERCKQYTWRLFRPRRNRLKTTSQLQVIFYYFQLLICPLREFLLAYINFQCTVYKTIFEMRNLCCVCTCRFDDQVLKGKLIGWNAPTKINLIHELMF